MIGPKSRLKKTQGREGRRRYQDKMKSAVTYLYKTSKEAVKERDERKEWRKTYDPDYLPRRSMLANKFENRKSRVMSMFGRPNRFVLLPFYTYLFFPVLGEQRNSEVARHIWGG